MNQDQRTTLRNRGVFHRLGTVVAALACLAVADGVLADVAHPLAKPTPQQYAWHEQERIMFVCLDPATWQGREYDDHSLPPSAIDPANLDTDQWCRAAQLWGAKEILFVAKHTGGFCWWQTDTSQYGVKESAWKEGKGDVLGELAESCRKHGINLGVYVYPGDDMWGAPMGSGGRTKDPAKQEAYNAVFRKQMTEVLTRYGAIAEVWFDGSCVIDVGDILTEHAANAVIFQGPQATIRWPGTENGKLPYPAWNSLKSEDLKTGAATAAQGNPDGDAWAPLEADTPLYDHNWFWSQANESKRKSLAELIDVYCKSAGRGGVLLLNSTPNTDGLIPDDDMKLYEAFGKEIDRRFGHPLAEVSDRNGTVVELELPRASLINYVVLMEDYREGERIRAYSIEGLSAGEWKPLSAGSSVGRKKIDVFRPTQVEKVRLRITQAAADPIIRSLAVFYAEGVSAGSLSLTTGRPTTASAFHSGPYVAEKATDGEPSTRWGTPDDTQACWLEVDLGAPMAFNRAAASELADRVRRFSIEYRNNTDERWEQAFKGKQIGADWRQDFKSVTGRYVRLNITEASGPPTLWEFNLYPAKPDWQPCGSWNAQTLRDNQATLTIDLTPFIPEPGQYEVRFTQTAGQYPLKILNATLLYEGSEATPGLLTRLTGSNTFNVNRTAQVTKESKSVLRVELAVPGAGICEGIVETRPRPSE